ncbi:hypothetical protein Hanom_Chr14g01301351 [Helianthus anomalus]
MSNISSLSTFNIRCQVPFLFSFILSLPSHLKPIFSTDEVSHPPPHPHTGDPKHHTPSGCLSFLRRPPRFSGASLICNSSLLQTPRICILSQICKRDGGCNRFGDDR